MKTLIIGLGWLGLPLADHLQKKGCEVKGTTRSISKQNTLAKQGYDAHLFDLFSDSVASQLNRELINNRNVVVNIAPGRKSIEVDRYVNALKGLFDYLAQCGAKHITFVSTTSVLGEQSGRLNESASPNPMSNSGIAHAQIESYLLNAVQVKAAIIRLAGLVGPNPNTSFRHPAYSLIKQSNIANGHQPVNLLHLEDAITFITKIIDKQTHGRVYHACSTEHPTRKDYYTWAARTLGLGEMDFKTVTNEHSQEGGKIVDATNSIKELGITLAYPSPYDML